MGLSMRTRQELTMAAARRYRRAHRREKSLMLDDFVADTGYSRAYAALVLRDCGGRLPYALDQSMVEAVASVKPRRAGGRPRVYTEEVRQAVEQLWELFGYLCGKRLVPVIRSSLPFLDEQELLQVPQPVTEALGCISPATVDRLLRARGAAINRAAVWLKAEVCGQSPLPVTLRDTSAWN